MKKQWKLLQKVKMKQIYWCCCAIESKKKQQKKQNRREQQKKSIDTFLLTKTRFSNQYQFSLLQFLLWQQQLTIIILVQFISYIQCSFNYMSKSQKSSSSFNKQIKSTPSSPLVMQQLIIYMSISTSESTEASHFDGINVTDFLETWENICQDHNLIKKLIMQQLSLYCKNLISKHIKSLSKYKSQNWEQPKNICRKTI